MSKAPFSAGKIKKLKDVVGHDESAETGDTHKVYCDQSKANHPHLDDLMPILADLIHKGLNMKGEGPLDMGDGMTFEHIERATFTKLRQTYGLNEAAYEKQAQNMSGGGTEPSGKSGSLFWFSPDKSSMLKSITELEVAKIIDILSDYADHFESAKKDKRLVLLCRFYGLYRFSVGKESVCLLAMNNIFGTQKPDRAYDMKGTTEDRWVDPKPGAVMKDLNYADLAVGLKSSDVEMIQAAVKADTDLIESHNIMDYSLLLGVYEDPKKVSPDKAASPLYVGVEFDETSGDTVPRAFRMGVIDMLVDYSGKKVAAHWLKKLTIGCCQQIDTEPPAYYQERFVTNAEEKICNEDGS